MLLKFYYFPILWNIFTIYESVVTSKAKTTEDSRMSSAENTEWYTSHYSNFKCLFEYKETEHGLVSAEAAGFELPENPIFFIETSCRGGLDFLQACSVESAARAHPNRQISVFFAGRVTRKNFTTFPLRALLKYSNIKFFKMHATKFSKGTPLEAIVVNHLKRSRYVIYHASDLLRFLTLYKFGGIYLDLDVIVVKSFDKLPTKTNFVGRERNAGIAVGVMSLSRTGLGREIIEEVFRYQRDGFNVDSWSSNGIGAMHGALEQVCQADISDITPRTCRGFKIYDFSYFYPVHNHEYYEYLQPMNKSFSFKNVFAFHMWNYLLNGEDIPENSWYAKITKTYCPLVDTGNKKLKKFERKRY